VLLAALLLSRPGSPATADSLPPLQPDRTARPLLLDIYSEVREMGPRPGEILIKREFFVGEDDDDTNKDIHVAIVIQPEGSGDKMTILVNYMRRDRKRRNVALTTHSRTLTCLLEGGRVEVFPPRRDQRRIDDILPGILRAVRDKKRLLRR